MKNFLLRQKNLIRPKTISSLEKKISHCRQKQIREKLRMLKDVCENGDDEQAREMLRKVVPTFKRPEEVNREVGDEVEPEDNSLPSVKNEEPENSWIR
ncbi:hypothetical protein [[Ruminococcus] torques]|uniref:hypothetical protein n=1 Tax=[Ruminococcus] torques TaxID=33039 RepID=UPI003520AF94